jgi:SulP family sulfate permease
VKTAPIAETVVMLVTVAATVSTGNLAIGVLAGLSSWHSSRPH